jgi:hypothetical protein
MSKPATDVFSTPKKADSLTRADALTTMAETTLRHGPAALSSAERYQVVVHVTAETLAAGTLDLDLAISGLIQSGERSTRAGANVSQV